MTTVKELKMSLLEPTTTISKSKPISFNLELTKEH